MYEIERFHPYVAGHSESPAFDVCMAYSHQANDRLCIFGFSSCSSTRYAVFGHSLGAWLAYEVTLHIQRLSKSRGSAASDILLPRALVVSCNRAPHLSGVEHDTDPTRLHQLQGDEFWAAFERRYGSNPYLVRFKIPFFNCQTLLELETYRTVAAATADWHSYCTATIHALL